MAIFGTKKKTSKAVGAEVKAEAPKARAAAPGGEHAHVLLNPRFTEKSALRAESGVYCFNISKRSSKRDVALAFSSRYGISPRKINIVSVVPKTVTSRGKIGRTASGKKAYIYLKKGETIEFV